MAPEFPPTHPRQQASGPDDGSTSLKWASNGELSLVDLQRVLERLTDPSLTRCQLDEST